MTKPRVFVALDYPDAASAFAMFRQLLPTNPYFKVGLELFVSAGPAFVQSLNDNGAKVFLDLKSHDIPNTAAGAVRSAVRMGVDYLNVHCGGGSEMLSAAVAAVADESKKLSIARPKLLGVTVLTSLDDKGIQEIGFPRSASAQVKNFVELAMNAGLDGVVCSAQELALVRTLAGGDFETMVPGIRPAGSAENDQKRTLTPKEAVQAGAHCLVIGRPITKASNPVASLEGILGEL
ncbi:MAG: orotidine-5'-phosphate decarboxylase [Bdellovibrionota bacterium]